MIPGYYANNFHREVAFSEEIMFNSHLLQLDLTVTAYQAVLPYRLSFDRKQYLDRLPAYTTARCPFCLAENVERFDTYSVRAWSRGFEGKSVFDPQAVIHHCPHFTFVEPFFNFHGLWPDEAKGLFGPEVPHVIGHVLERSDSLAVMHALPVCLIKDDAFIPSYTLFLITYFSESPENVRRATTAFNMNYTDEPYSPSPFLAGCRKNWGDLPYWVSTEKLYWVDGETPTLEIRTNTISDFPFQNITGRKYAHRFPYPLHK